MADEGAKSVEEKQESRKDDMSTLPATKEGEVEEDVIASTAPDGAVEKKEWGVVAARVAARVASPVKELEEMVSNAVLNCCTSNLNSSISMQPSIEVAIDNGTEKAEEGAGTSLADEEDEEDGVVRVAVIGCGWWAQGWHLPHLAANSPRVKIAAVCDPNSKPVSTLASSPLLSLSELSKKYNCPYFTSVEDLLADRVGPKLDGAIISTSHASHFDVGVSLFNEGIYRRQMSGNVHRIINILMEKPMTTEVEEARRLWEMSTKEYPEGTFIINHTASYRPQTKVARHIIASDQLGKIRHISASMNGPLMWLFNDPSNHSWVSKTPWKTVSQDYQEEEEGEYGKVPMAGNGYAYGQIAHVLAWIYAVLGASDKTATEDIAVPTKVYCEMSHTCNTGADVSFAAVISCHDRVTFSLSGTALLPGSQYADPPVGKHINVEIFGEKGCLIYGGDDRIPESGRLELRKTAVGQKEDGQSEFPCSNRDWSKLLGDSAASELKFSDGFYFEDGEQEGTGPGSLKAFLGACCSSSDQYASGNDASSSTIDDSLIGLRTVQVIDAMYRSSISGKVEKIEKVPMSRELVLLNPDN